MNRFFHLHESPDPKIRNAFRFATLCMLAALVAIPVDGYLAIRTGAWQLWCGAGTIVFILVAALISRQLARTGKTERAGRTLIYSILIAVLANTFLIANIGIALAIAGIVLTVEIDSRTTERPEFYVILSFVMATATVVLDLFLPAYRLVVPELQLFVPIIVAVLVIVLGYMVIRDFQDYSLRIKMVIVILAIVMVSVATVAFVTNRSLNANLTASVGDNMRARANTMAVGIAQVLDREVSLLRILSMDEMIQFLARDASIYYIPLSQSELEKLDNQWKAAYAKNDNTDPLVTSVLYNRNADPLWRFKERFPQHLEVFLTDQQGVLLAATNITSDYYQADEEWWQAAVKKGLYIGPPEYDESTKTTSIIIAMAFQVEGSKKTAGVFRTTVTLESLAQALGSGLLEQTGRAVIYLPDGREMEIQPQEDGTTAITVGKSEINANTLEQSKENSYFEINYDKIPMLASQVPIAIPGGTDETSLTISELNWRVVAFQNKTEALRPVNIQTRNIIILASIIFIAATFAALGLAYVIAGPIIRLTTVAEKVSAGDLSVQAKVETGDEIGTLARTFNSMTTQLGDLVGTLEHRVADRTKALATSAEVSRNLSTILNERQLIIEVVEQLKAAFDYYHVHIYLVDEVSGDLVMAGGTGDVGATMLSMGHKIPRGKGLVGRAAQTNVPVLVLDTSKDPAWLPNPLLPETKCEAALPISTGDKVLGILDVQDDEINGLTIEDFRLLQSLTSQIAIALMNARSYMTVQERAEREARITSIGLKIKNTTSIDAALQVAARELGRTLSSNDIRVILEAPGMARDEQETS